MLLQYFHNQDPKEIKRRKNSNGKTRASDKNSVQDDAVGRRGRGTNFEANRGRVASKFDLDVAGGEDRVGLPGERGTLLHGN